jgi:HSP20 family molecular chaperone IbpA
LLSLQQQCKKAQCQQEQAKKKEAVTSKPSRTMTEGQQEWKRAPPTTTTTKQEGTLQQELVAVTNQNVSFINKILINIEQDDQQVILSIAVPGYSVSNLHTVDQDGTSSIAGT